MVAIVLLIKVGGSLSIGWIKARSKEGFFIQPSFILTV